MAAVARCDTSSSIECHGDALLGRCLAGRFQLRQLIGAGACGCVYRAEQVALRRDVAVKVLNPRLASDPEFVERLHHEALAASRLNHPNVVSIIDFGQSEDGLFFIVMEYLRGRTLTEMKRRIPALPLARVIAIVDQLLRGLHAAHTAGVIHADLKSDNIMVEELDSGDLVKVVDFGIARLLDPLLPIRGRRMHNAQPKICGTPEYMAPEVIRGGKPEQASDIYAAGVILHELLTGRPPFTGASMLDTLRRHIEEPAPRLSRVRPELGLPEALEDAVLCALAKEPAERHESAAAFRLAIERALAPTPAHTPPLGNANGYGLRARGTGPVSRVSEEPCDIDGTTIEMAATELFSDMMRHPGVMAPAVVTTAAARIDPIPHGPFPHGPRTAEVATMVDFCLGGGPWDVLQIAAGTESAASRLVREGLDLLGNGITFYVTGADPTGMARPWYPIRELLAAAMSLPSAPSGGALALATAHLDEHTRTAVVTLFELAGKGQRGASGRLAHRQQAHTFARAVNTIVRESAPGLEQLLVVFEGVHRYDAASIELLQVLCTSGFDAGMRAILTMVPPFDIGVRREVAHLPSASM